MASLKSLPEDGQRIGEGHFALYVAGRVFSRLLFCFFQISKAQPGDGKDLRLERASNELALNAESCE